MIFRFVLVGLFNGLTGSRDAVRKDWVGSSQFGPDHLHHPVPPNRRCPGRVKTGRFCGDFSRYLSVLSVSGDTCGLSGRFQPPVSASKNSVPQRRVAAVKAVRELGNLGSFGTKTDLSSRVRNYRGFNPRASNCWLHSAGASRSRSTPMPRGKRPSTAARTRSGARNAREIVMLTWRTLHF
jgi:hypothetical protein